MTNEIKAAENQEVENKLTVGTVAQSNDRYDVVVNEEGKYVRKAKYEEFCSVVPQNKAEKVALFNLLEGGEENTNGLKDHVGQIIEIENVIFRPYDKVNEETGALEYGVLTYLITPEGVPYVTSSKSVYFSMKNIFKVFGSPVEEDWENIKIKVVKKKGLQHQYIDVKLEV